MQYTNDRSLKELSGNLTHSITTLFRKEIEHAGAEISCPENPRRPWRAARAGASRAHKSPVLGGDVMELISS
jgi:hypothetical protein